LDEEISEMMELNRVKNGLEGWEGEVWVFGLKNEFHFHMLCLFELDIDVTKLDIKDKSRKMNFKCRF
jgi:hypothetical protein